MKIISPGSVLGIIGGGQLGRMTALAAANLGYKIHIYTPEKNSPASLVSYKTTVASYTDQKALKKFAESVDVITFEFENIPVESVKFLEMHAEVRPSNKALHISQNRLREKTFINKLEIKTAEFRKITSVAGLKKAAGEFGGQGILKSTELGYDGKGQFRISRNSNLEKIWKDAKLKESVLEKIVPFKKEISVIVARSPNGKTLSFPAAENIHENGILRESFSPANISKDLDLTAQNIAARIADSLDLIGLLAVEFFVTKDDELLVNEIAPRPHNSGHWTMDGCATSQFEQFVRAVCGLPLGLVRPLAKKTTMHNLLGNEIDGYKTLLKDSFAKLHLYGKKDAKPGRKMGHVNILKF